MKTTRLSPERTTCPGSMVELTNLRFPVAVFGNQDGRLIIGPSPVFDDGIPPKPGLRARSVFAPVLRTATPNVGSLVETKETQLFNNVGTPHHNIICPFEAPPPGSMVGGAPDPTQPRSDEQIGFQPAGDGDLGLSADRSSHLHVNKNNADRRGPPGRNAGGRTGWSQT